MNKHLVFVFFLLLTCPAFGQELEDGTIANDSTRTVPEMSVDTTKRISYWHITRRTGEMFKALPDTFLTDYFNRTNVEGQSIAMAYLGNLGLPGESRIFFERDDRSPFMFEDPYSAYMRTPERFNFLNTKMPHTNLSYQRAGGRIWREERFQALLTSNFGKKLNVGFDVDYLYARGFYQSQSAKHLDWVFFGNYLSDRHQVHLFINPKDYTNAENGGILNDTLITHPGYANDQNMTTRDIQTALSNGENTTWNQLKGNQLFLNYHYNLGFKRKTTRMDEEGDTIKQFIPVSSIIYTFDYKTSKKKFYTADSTQVADYYANKIDRFPNREGGVNDSIDYWSLSNTLALSLREGFSHWAKFDLTAFITQDIRTFTMMDLTDVNYTANQSSTVVGGELAKRTGKILRYHGQGSLGILGDNLGDLNLSGTIETRIPVWGDTASIQADASIKNLSPTLLENHYRSRYFWWDNDFSNIKKVYIGGKIDIPHTKTTFSLGVENVSNYIYFQNDGLPAQDGGSIQILAARLDQNFQLQALHWNNQVVYQTSSNEAIIPLPALAAYTSLYLQFKIAKVLTIQMGANAHYWTKYYAPSYEPATQQFKIQDKIKVGNYPLISGFLNCHLKQTRFFLEYYNASAMFISPTEYFSLPHYPVNPALLKLGLSVDFIN
ncbi:MAG: putative porin [Candidatus Symbiothrix sp.]|jgi:hypothetical protein|nr:putative porin [Candidatus Symbiothrix sp.]